MSRPATHLGDPDPELDGLIARIVACAVVRPAAMQSGQIGSEVRVFPLQPHEYEHLVRALVTVEEGGERWLYAAPLVVACTPQHVARYAERLADLPEALFVIDLVGSRPT